MKAISQPGSLYWLAFVLLAVDQVAKMASRFYQPNFGWPAFGFAYHANPAAAFSIALPAPWPTVLATLFFIFLLLTFRLTKKPSPTYIPLLLMLTAAASNLVDRLVYGAVTDYLVINNGYLNLADLILCIGALAFIKNALFASTEQIR